MKNNVFIHESSVVDNGAVIGDNTKIWHFCHISAKVVIGDNCNIGQNVFIADEVVIGNNVKIQNNVSIYTGVTIEDDAFLGPSMVFTNVLNPRSHVNRRHEFLQTRIGRGASIGANATIVCGNEIGKFALVGAGSVVTKPVKNYALVVGNPARQTGWVSERGCKLLFDKSGSAVCPETGECYLLKNGEVEQLNSIH